MFYIIFSQTTDCTDDTDDYKQKPEKPSATVCDLRSSLPPRSFVPESELSRNVRVINVFVPNRRLHQRKNLALCAKKPFHEFVFEHELLESHEFCATCHFEILTE